MLITFRPTRLSYLNGHGTSTSHSSPPPRMKCSSSSLCSRPSTDCLSSALARILHLASSAPRSSCQISMESSTSWSSSAAPSSPISRTRQQSPYATLHTTNGHAVGSSAPHGHGSRALRSRLLGGLYSWGCGCTVRHRQ